MEEQKKKKLIELPATTMDWLKLVLYIIAIVSLAWLGLNQFQGYVYKAEFLGTPCDLCAELNPRLDDCINQPAVVTPYIIQIP